jgi:hypothetical protein
VAVAHLEIVEQATVDVGVAVASVLRACSSAASQPDHRDDERVVDQPVRRADHRHAGAVIDVRTGAADRTGGDVNTRSRRARDAAPALRANGWSTAIGR